MSKTFIQGGSQYYVLMYEIYCGSMAGVSSHADENILIWKYLKSKEIFRLFFLCTFLENSGSSRGSGGGASGGVGNGGGVGGSGGSGGVGNGELAMEVLVAEELASVSLSDGSHSHQ